MLHYKRVILFFIFFQFTQAQTKIEPAAGVIIKTLSQQWELDAKDKRGTFRLVSYKPIYVTTARWSSNINGIPKSENPDYSATIPVEQNNYEAKFQLSFKTKVLQDFLFGKGNLWVGFTQKAHWQIYNAKFSRAFRELNYEPELIVNFPLKVEFINGRFRMIGMSFNHQSNGRDLPYSRSWNRIIFHLEYEINNWQITIKPWIRSTDADDENPLITKYVGNGELNLNYNLNRHQFYAIMTHPFTTLKYGGIQLNYVFPIKGHLRGQLQIFEGYGETLIDYNHRQTTVGLGVSFANW